MPPKDFSVGYLDWERKQEQKREQFRRDVQRGVDALTEKRQNRIGAVVKK